MTERLKRWESPRRQGRNDKGKGGSARARQLRKQQKMLRKKLKDNSKDAFLPRRDSKSLLFFLVFFVWLIPKKLPRVGSDGLSLELVFSIRMSIRP